MAFWRAFSDDSGSVTGDRRLFFAGYLNRAENWALFADAWHEELTAAPAIDYLRMNEAWNLVGQFDRRNGWDERLREEKLKSLARVIRHFDPISFQVSLDRAYFDQVLKPVSPRGLGQAHFVVCSSTISMIARLAVSMRLQGKVELFFDQQDGVEEDMSLLFPVLMSTLPWKARHILAGPPQFRDDKQLYPLQAADMLAWHIRRDHDEGALSGLSDLIQNKRLHVVSEVPNDLLKQWAEHHATHPGVPLVQSKQQWRRFKREFYGLMDSGVDPVTFGLSRWQRWRVMLAQKWSRLFR